MVSGAAIRPIQYPLPVASHVCHGMVRAEKPLAARVKWAGGQQRGCTDSTQKPVEFEDTLPYFI